MENVNCKAKMDKANFPSAKEMRDISEEAFGAALETSLHKCRNAILGAAQFGCFCTEVCAERNYVDVMEVLIKKGYDVVFIPSEEDIDILEISWKGESK